MGRNNFLSSQYAGITNSETHHRLWRIRNSVHIVNFMFALAALMSLIGQVSGTPYIPGGDSPAGTDCSGLASWVANVASGRPAYGSRFHTGNMESALLARGFHYGSAPNSVVIGWNGGHAAVTLPDGTPVSSGESGSGVRIGGGGAFQPQFTRHMYLPMEAQEMDPAAATDGSVPATGDALAGPADVVTGPADLVPGPADVVAVAFDPGVGPDDIPAPVPDADQPSPGIPEAEVAVDVSGPGPADAPMVPTPEPGAVDMATNEAPPRPQ